MVAQSTDEDRVAGNETLTGIFAGPVVGLRYETPTLSGLTDEGGAFRYRAGETVTFLIGRVVLGATEGAARVNLAQLVPSVAGNIDKLHDPSITNRARLLQSLGRNRDIEDGVVIAPAVHDAIGDMVIPFDPPPVIHSAASSKLDPFEGSSVVTGLLARLDATPDAFATEAPRRLRGAAASRNALRRDIRGIRKSTDVRIPTRDGSFLYADVFRPAGDGRHPVVMSLSFYGKSFYHECICSEADSIAKEELEDRYFSGNPDGLQYENHETVNTSEWVPNGYAVVRVDARGVCGSPGRQAPLGRQEAEDYYDCIEWAARQPWCNGAVGLWGMSYVAMTQHNVASLCPPSLKAMIALGTDSDPYNEYLSGGGLWAEAWWMWWTDMWSGHNHCGERRKTGWMESLRANPFNDSDLYHPHSAFFMKPDLDRATAAVWIVGPQTGAVIHQLGSSETFIRSTNAADRRFDFVDAWFPHSYRGSTVAEHMRYFDHWLKGEDNGVAGEKPVRIQVRTGNAAFYLLEENEWPIARTQYVRFHLDASPSDWPGDERTPHPLRLSATPPDTERSADYDARLVLGQSIPFPKGHVGGTPRWSTGITFVSEKMPEDMVLAGYMKVGVFVSSTSSDMDVHASLRVIDENDREIRFEAIVLPIDPEHIHPVGYGTLKVSHRKLDTARSTDYWPVHTHLAADHAPLAAGEIVAVEFGLNPSTALIRRGHRLRLDLQPNVPAGLPSRSYDPSYHDGATNTIYTGPHHPGYVQLPLIPRS